MLYYIYTHTIYIQIYQFMSWSDRPPNLRSSDSQDQETFLAPSADKQTCNYDKECSNHHPSLSTLGSKGLSHSKMK